MTSSHSGVHHPELAAGRWRELSLAAQLANIGSEVGRMLTWRQRNERLMDRAFERALELLDLTLADPRWRGRLREIARAREMLCDAASGGHEYDTTLEWMDRYFLAFAVAERNRTDQERHGAGSRGDDDSGRTGSARDAATVPRDP
ncbi:MAG: hypothetical protein ACREOJ_01830 [Gemmatimonadaceae bacterium]